MISRSASERGQSLVELAISLTVMLMLLSGAVAFGMALFSYVAMRDAAQEGALYGSFNPCIDENGDGKCQTTELVNDINIGPGGDVGICKRVQESSHSPVDMVGFVCTHDGAIPHAGNNIDVIATTGQPCEGNVSGVPNGVRVTVEYNYPVFMPFIGAITGDHIHLTATVTDTILEPRCP